MKFWAAQFFPIISVAVKDFSWGHRSELTLRTEKMSAWYKWVACGWLTALPVTSDLKENINIDFLIAQHKGGSFGNCGQNKHESSDGFVANKNTLAVSFGGLIDDPVRFLLWSYFPLEK